MSCVYCFSQSLNFDQLDRKKWLRYNGGIAANGIFYDGTATRQNLTYYLSGNLNFTIAGLYNIPLSFTYSNQKFNFPTPFNFNRLSLHPSYQWATVHLGDVSMTFSPYTLSGHQFTGAGFELHPKGKFQISAMYGRFLSATEYDTITQGGMTSYKRIGYGIKTAYDFDFMKLGLILFKASDHKNSLENPLPIELNLAPKENAVLSFASDFHLINKATIHMEYAVSGVTEDIRQTSQRHKGLLSFLLKENSSTNYYNALNVAFNYSVGTGSLGISYERIDPDYKTLGAYYFNNDSENITLNANQAVFNNKLNVHVNAGLQKDNLDKSKTADQRRIVTAITANLTASDRLILNGSYSNFQSYTNIRDQFDYINQVGAFDTLDTLNFRQISQNTNLSFNYVLKKTEQKQHSTNLNLVYQSSNNQQEGETIVDGLSSFYNGTAAYTLGYPQDNLTISVAANTSYTLTGEDKSLILGPTIAVGKHFFDKQLRANFSSSYNSSHTNGTTQNSIFNIRLGSTYVWLERQNFTLNLLLLFRNASLNSNRDLTLSFGYSYSFDNFSIHLKKGEANKRITFTTERTEIWSFRYRNVSYSGTIPELNEQLSTVFNSTQFSDIPSFKRDDLSLLLTMTKTQKEEEPYKENALDFLKELYAYEDFRETYEKILFTVIRKIQLDMRKIDLVLERLFVAAKLEVDSHSLHKKKANNYTAEDLIRVPVYNVALKEQEIRLLKLVGHRWMEKKFIDFTDISVVKNPAGYLKEFKQMRSQEAYKIFDTTANLDQLETYLENQIIDFYYKKSLKVVNPENFELKYINKN